VTGGEVPLGGNVAGAVRVGATVRRPAGPWTPAVHALLRHLERQGVDGVPRALGLDGGGREMLSVVPGRAVALPPPAWLHDDACLAATGRLLRVAHDATTGFVPPPGARWRLLPGAPARGDVVCHNDVAPYNLLYDGGVPIGLVDWDLAGPGPRLWDLAHAVWRCAGIGADGGPPAEQGHRARVLVDAYGLEDRRDLVDLLVRRMDVLVATIRPWADAGDPAFVAMRGTEHEEGPLRDRAFVRRHRDELRAGIG
jgi:hypothetical protein